MYSQRGLFIYTIADFVIQNLNVPYRCTVSRTLKQFACQKDFPCGFSNRVMHDFLGRMLSRTAPFTGVVMFSRLEVGSGVRGAEEWMRKYATHEKRIYAPTY